MHIQNSLSCIFTCLLVCSVGNAKPNKKILRINGGRNATEEEFPYVVKLTLQSLDPRIQNNLFICTCSVLTSKWTLTAGHCITGMVEYLMALNQTQTKAVIEYQPSPKADVAYSEVINTVVHPGINLQQVKNDIALIYTQPVLFVKYGKVSPIDYVTLTGQQVSVVGYGMMKDIKEQAPHLPRVLDVVVNKCSDTFRHPQICFAPPCSTARVAKAVCAGDSGGPAIHVSGIVSVNALTDIHNCGAGFRGLQAMDRYEVGYDAGSATPVSPFADWIATVLNTEIA